MHEKAEYVLSQGQIRSHHCHWPNCKEQVPPAKWGCRKHWFALPLALRNKIWAAFRPGQEKDMKPSEEYLAAANEVQHWIVNNYCPGGLHKGIDLPGGRKGCLKCDVSWDVIK